MKIKISAFGYLSELTEERFEVENVTDVISLKSELEKKFPGIKKLEYKIAVNRELANGNVSINEFSEVVLLPPFAGG